MRRLLWTIVGSALASHAAAGTLHQGLACLERLDVPCARAVVDDLGAGSSTNPNVLALAARTNFYDAQYDEALKQLEQAVAYGFDDPWDDVGLYRRTRDATQGWVEHRVGNYRVNYRPGVDAVLLEDTIEALEGAEQHIAPLLGGAFPGDVIVELFPDGRSFIAASSLTEENVRTTGVVALSKWSRLLITSPRALGRGYPWQDTIAHEYIHMVVAHHSDDKVPVWLQEAIAKYLDNRWRGDGDGFRLSVRQQGLLADALARDTLVSFEQMHPSLAKLPSAELASLAYAQVSTMMAFAFEQAGDDVLPAVFEDIRGGTDAAEALARGAGFVNFVEFEAAWLVYLQGLELRGERLAEMPTVLDGGDQLDSDPVLSERADLARWVRIGDLLQERGHHQAALVEYAKAVPVDEPQSPLLSNRMAQAHLALGDERRASAALEESLRNYPEFALSHKTLGAIRQREGSAEQAVASYIAALELNPFDPEVQQELVSLYRYLGQEEDAGRHERYLRILRRGGED